MIITPQQTADDLTRHEVNAVDIDVDSITLHLSILSIRITATTHDHPETGEQESVLTYERITTP